jgi:thymidylate synthase
LKAGDFIHTIGDAHVYSNHVEALQEQLKRSPRAFPKLIIKDPTKERGIDDFVYDDFEVIGYKPQKTIKMQMAV